MYDGKRNVFCPVCGRLADWGGCSQKFSCTADACRWNSKFDTIDISEPEHMLSLDFDYGFEDYFFKYSSLKAFFVSLMEENVKVQQEIRNLRGEELIQVAKMYCCWNEEVIFRANPAGEIDRIKVESKEFQNLVVDAFNGLYKNPLFAKVLKRADGIWLIDSEESSLPILSYVDIIEQYKRLIKNFK